MAKKYDWKINQFHIKDVKKVEDDLNRMDEEGYEVQNILYSGEKIIIIYRRCTPKGSFAI